jgi:hypothetical protein
LHLFIAENHAMKIKAFLGVVLLVLGLIAAVAVVIGRTSTSPQDKSAVVGDQNQGARSETVSVVLPIVAGLTIACGAALIGIGMGHFTNPTVVPPNSPHASEAATSRGPTPRA